MHLATCGLVLGMMMGVLGAADARAPELQAVPANITTMSAKDGMADLRLMQSPDGLLRPNPRIINPSSSRAPGESAGDLWLFAGVSIGLIGYQLRRKHKLLRPHPFALQSDH